MKKNTQTIDPNKSWVVICVVVLILAVYFYVAFLEIRSAKTPAPAADKSESPLLMTVAELKAYPGFENMDDEVAKEYISGMQRFCMITYKLYTRKKTNSDEKQS